MITEMQELRARCERAGQGHVFDNWEKLGERDRERLAGQIGDLDWRQVGALANLLRQDPAGGRGGELEPPEIFPLDRGPAEAARATQAVREGEELLREGRVGYVLVAGGQASRLGYEGPKGAFPIGPVSGRSLFELHARRLRAAVQRYGAEVAWYVMTSPANDVATRDFFAVHEHFGLPPRNVFFFSQATVPAMDVHGRLLMAGPGDLFLSPNGHGGVLLALRTSGALEDMRGRGIEFLSYFQVDNPLARPADPLFIGLHAQAGAGMSSKIVAKRDAAERVGVLGRRGGSLCCIEYSDLPEALREARDADRKLRFRAGNIAVHIFSADFVSELTEGELQLPWHVARKSMKVFEEGRMVERTGVKFETFVFDALHRSPSSVTLEVDRGFEFSPVKNASGEDSPATARRDLCNLFATWVRDARLPVPPAGSDGCIPVEVDPLLAETAVEFQKHAGRRARVLRSGHLYE